MLLTLDNKRKSITFKGKVAGLLKKLGIRREEVVIKVNGKLAPETMKVNGQDKVEVIRVVFGG